MKVSYVSWSRIREYVQAPIVRGNLQFEEHLIIVTIDGFLLKMGRT